MVGTAEGHVVRPGVLVSGSRQDDEDAPARIEDLDARAGRDEQIAVGVHAHAVEVGMASVGGKLGVEVGQLVGERPVGLNAVGIDVAPREVGHEELALVGG